MNRRALYCGLWLAASVCGGRVALAGTDMDDLAKSPAGEKHAYGSEALQFGELSLPEGAGPFPVVINIHGGCWLSDYGIAHSRALAGALAKEGFAVWNIEYRRVGDSGGGWPGTFVDVARGADYLRTLAKERPLDLSKVTAIGHSAGGHLALWLAVRHKMPQRSEIHVPDPIAVTGVVALAPAPMLDALQAKGVCGGVIEKLMGGAAEGVVKRYDLAMPSRMAPIGVRQMIVIGEEDKSWRWVGESYVEKARAAGDGQIEVVLVPRAGHMEVIDPGSAAWKSVVEAVRKVGGGE